MERRAFMTSSAAAGGAALFSSFACGADSAVGIRQSKPDPSVTSPKAPTSDAVFSLSGVKPIQFPGGMVREMTAADYPPIPNMASALIDLDVGGMRGLHWHDTAGELGYVVKGRVLLTVVDSDNNREITALNEGDIYSVPMGFAGRSSRTLSTSPTG